jgi:hypothetical protein
MGFFLFIFYPEFDGRKDKQAQKKKNGYGIYRYVYQKNISQNNDGSKVTYIQLAHDVWDSEAKCSKTEVIYSFGREDKLDMDSLKRP